MTPTRWGRVTVGALVVVAVLVGADPVSGAGPWGASYFPNVPLITQDGTTVRFYDDLLKGKAVAINLIFTSCTDACPLETARLVQVQRLLGERMGRGVFFYSITLDPARDTPEVLKAYAARFGVGPGWLFLTGKEADLRLVSRKLGLSRPGDAARRDGHGHAPILMIGNEPAGRWMRNSAVDNPRFLAATLTRFLLNDNGATPRKSYAEAPHVATRDATAYLFRSRCGACHTIGGGESVGPDLLGVTAKRDRSWLTRWLAAPDRMLADRDPIATDLLAKYGNVAMPNLRLGPTEIAALLAYIETASAARGVRSDASP